MTITFVDRIQGYSSYLAQPRHSPLVWQVCKDSFIRDPLILDQLKHYARSPQKLSVLYEMVGFYDRPPRKMPKDDPLLEACFCQARKAFDLSEEGKNKTPMRHINDLEPKMFTLSTNPGLPYAHWGFTKKADVFEMAKKRARYLCHRIKEQQPVRLPPTMIFARNSITERGKRKVRGVWGKPFDLLIAESSIYLPWLERMHQTKKLPNGYKYTMYHRGYRQLWDDITSVSQPGRSTYIMLDFKKYDTTLAPWLLRRARDIIDAQIDFSRYERWGHPVAERSRRLARRLFKATVDTEFLMPDGFLWKKDVGTDSGSLMFQRDEDIATYVIGRYLAARLGHKVEFICVLGDDIIMSIPGRHHIDFNLAASILAEVFGVELNLDKSYSTLEITEASFLGRYLHYGHPRRDTVDIVLSALYPKETDRSLLDVAQRTVALMYENAYVNPHAHKFLTRIWESLPPDIKDYCVSGSFAWDWKWRKIFRTYGLQHPPRCAPPSFDFIFWLLETPDGRFIYHPSGYGT